jgi:hypothetical protein
MPLFGMKDKQKTKGQTRFSSSQKPLTGNEPLFDIIQRSILGQQLSLKDTPISVPLQQSISGMQDVMQPLFNQAFGAQTGQGLAGRLAGQGASPGIQPAAGAPVFGRTQTREELGLPSRRENFPFTPTAEEFKEKVGLPPVTKTGRVKRKEKKLRTLKKHEARREARIERREAAGKGTAKLERRQRKTRRKIAHREL